VITARRMLEHFAAHPRFGVHAYALLERTVEGHWSATFSTDDHAGEVAEQTLSASETEVLASRKVLGVAGDNAVAIFIPFTRVHPRIRFEPVAENLEYKAQASQHLPNAIHAGDLVLGLLYRGEPRQGVVHSILYFRQYYYETYYPALLNNARRLLFERTRLIQRTIHTVRREERSSDPWGPFIQTCAVVFPTLGIALGVCITVRIFDVGTHSLKRIYHWDLPETRRTISLEDTEVLSLRRGERGVNATTPIPQQAGIDEASPSGVSIHTTPSITTTTSTWLVSIFADVKNTGSTWSATP